MTTKDPALRAKGIYHPFAAAAVLVGGGLGMLVDPLATAAVMGTAGVAGMAYKGIRDRRNRRSIERGDGPRYPMD